MSIEFEIKNSKIKDVFVIKPSRFEDKRGYIYTSYIAKEIIKYSNNKKFEHDKFVYSKQNVLRGIHGDTKTYKLVTCVYGKIFQVVVDLRKNSSTYLQYETFIIEANEPTLILIPPMVGNAFLVLSEDSVYNYKLAYTGEYIDADKQFTVKWNSEILNINWPIKEPILSDRDLNNGKECNEI